MEPSWCPTGYSRETDRSLVESPWPALPGILEVIAISSVMTGSSQARYCRIIRATQNYWASDHQESYWKTGDGIQVSRGQALSLRTLCVPSTSTWVLTESPGT
ncbi:hypothetical protein MUG91_G43n105 [Manis pentadactyla]|nr:hypothetical protein MUG91_G43n105 [Manis pentadactyla]